MWKQELDALLEGFDHPAWGYAHCRRVYATCLKLAEDERTAVDTDALLAASRVHDLGAFPPYRREGVDHADRSAQVAAELLPGCGFPAAKIPLVQAIISGHMFYRDPGGAPEAVIFHDADVLDFMGWVGITRLLAVTGLDDWAPNLGSAVELIRKFSRELLDRLYLAASREIGRGRREEMAVFLTGLGAETEDWAHL
jgi:uncharacterized protein